MTGENFEYEFFHYNFKKGHFLGLFLNLVTIRRKKLFEKKTVYKKRVQIGMYCLYCVYVCIIFVR